jgi:hypothetical protein
MPPKKSAAAPRDISSEIERLRVAREETPAVASVPSARPRGLAPSVESIQKAKASEFPVAPATLSVGGGTGKGGEKKKTSATKARLMKMLAARKDNDEE